MLQGIVTGQRKTGSSSVSNPGPASPPFPQFGEGHFKKIVKGRDPGWKHYLSRKTVRVKIPLVRHIAVKRALHVGSVSFGLE